MAGDDEAGIQKEEREEELTLCLEDLFFKQTRGVLVDLDFFFPSKHILFKPDRGLPGPLPRSC